MLLYNQISMFVPFSQLIQHSFTYRNHKILIFIKFLDVKSEKDLPSYFIQDQSHQYLQVKN